MELACSFGFAEKLPSFTGQIKGNDVNVRADSTASSEIIGKLNNGQLVEVIREAYDWYKIKLPEDSEILLYVSKELIEPLPEDKISPSSNISFGDAKVKTGRVLGNNVNIRLKPTVDSAVIGRINQNEVVKITQDKGQWYSIKPTAECYGWIHKKFVKKFIGQAATAPVKPTTSQIAKKDTITELAAGIQQNNSASTISTIEGIIKPCGRFFNRKGTHRLINKEGTYYLHGDKKTLDAVIGRKVEVTGNLIAYPKYKVIEIKNLKILE
jgi:N-acetylmuramoyl-L-alanine amidase